MVEPPVGAAMGNRRWPQNVRMAMSPLNSETPTKRISAARRKAAGMHGACRDRHNGGCGRRVHQEEVRRRRERGERRAVRAGGRERHAGGAREPGVNDESGCSLHCVHRP